jgi:hypothetical protein
MCEIISQEEFLSLLEESKTDPSAEVVISAILFVSHLQDQAEWLTADDAQLDALLGEHHDAIQIAINHLGPRFRHN